MAEVGDTKCIEKQTPEGTREICYRANLQGDGIRWSIISSKLKGESQYSEKELRQRHNKRSQDSIDMDLDIQANDVIDMDSPRTAFWMKNPNQHDIKGLDTKGSPRTPTKFFEEETSDGIDYGDEIDISEERTEKPKIELDEKMPDNCEEIRKGKYVVCYDAKGEFDKMVRKKDNKQYDEFNNLTFKIMNAGKGYDNSEFSEIWTEFTEGNIKDENLLYDMPEKESDGNIDYESFGLKTVEKEKKKVDKPKKEKKEKEELKVRESEGIEIPDIKGMECKKVGYNQSSNEHIIACLDDGVLKKIFKADEDGKLRRKKGGDPITAGLNSMGMKILNSIHDYSNAQYNEIWGKYKEKGIIEQVGWQYNSKGKFPKYQIKEGMEEYMFLPPLKKDGTIDWDNIGKVDIDELEDISDEQEETIEKKGKLTKEELFDMTVDELYDFGKDKELPVKRRMRKAEMVSTILGEEVEKPEKTTKKKSKGSCEEIRDGKYTVCYNDEGDFEKLVRKKDGKEYDEFNHRTFKIMNGGKGYTVKQFTKLWSEYKNGNIVDENLLYDVPVKDPEDDIDFDMFGIDIPESKINKQIDENAGEVIEIDEITTKKKSIEEIKEEVEKSIMNIESMKEDDVKDGEKFCVDFDGKEECVIYDTDKFEDEEEFKDSLMEYYRKNLSIFYSANETLALDELILGEEEQKRTLKEAIKLFKGEEYDITPEMRFLRDSKKLIPVVGSEAYDIIFMSLHPDIGMEDMHTLYDSYGIKRYEGKITEYSERDAKRLKEVIETGEDLRTLSEITEQANEDVEDAKNELRKFVNIIREGNLDVDEIVKNVSSENNSPWVKHLFLTYLSQLGIPVGKEYYDYSMDLDSKKGDRTAKKPLEYLENPDYSHGKPVDTIKLNLEMKKIEDKKREEEREMMQEKRKEEYIDKKKRAVKFLCGKSRECLTSDKIQEELKIPVSEDIVINKDISMIFAPEKDFNKFINDYKEMHPTVDKLIDTSGTPDEKIGFKSKKDMKKFMRQKDFCIDDVCVDGGNVWKANRILGKGRELDYYTNKFDLPLENKTLEVNQMNITDSRDVVMLQEVDE